jgi:hypothetical protein
MRNPKLGARRIECCRAMANSISTQVVLSPVFLVSLEEELTVLDRLLSVTCADLVVCLLLPRSGASGTKRSTWVKSRHFPHYPSCSNN